MQSNEDTLRGFWLALSGYLLWGIFPIYFYILREVSAPEILVHRVIWSMLLLLLVSRFLTSQTNWLHLFKSKSTLIPCLFSTFFLSINWLIFIWAVANGKAIGGSLGYFINPLVSVLMAVIVLNERLNKYQIIAILFAVLGVSLLAFKVGEFPWIALALAISFGTYGLIHKKYAVDAFAGLTFETVLATPFALAYLVYLFSIGQNAFLSISWQVDGLLLAAGLITSIPLLLFLASLSQLRLSTVGILQFTTPSIQFIVAIFILAEPLSWDKLIAFSVIWFGLSIFCFDTLRQRRIKNRMRHQQ